THQDAREPARLVASPALLERPAGDRERRVRSAVGHEPLHGPLCVGVHAPARVDDLRLAAECVLPADLAREYVDATAEVTRAAARLRIKVLPPDPLRRREDAAQLDMRFAEVGLES